MFASMTYSFRGACMSEVATSLSQSKFYSPAFNTAIFDGPFRIYFSQAQEAYALKIYFYLQKKLGDQFKTAKQNYKSKDQNLYIMLYPNDESFERSFDVAPFDENLSIELFYSEFVIGVNGELAEEALTPLFDKIKHIVDDWELEVPMAIDMQRPLEAF